MYKRQAEELNAIDEMQFGFKEGFSSEHAALSLANEITTGFKKGEDSAVVFLDISNAFPSIWHDGLLLKMARKKFPTIYIRLLKSFLADRQISVKIDEHTSVRKTLNNGLPQGGVLSPLLYSIFANDFFQMIRNDGTFDPRAFADDKALIRRFFKDHFLESKVNIALKKIHKWSLKWHINFSSRKTKLVIFSKHNVTPAYSFRFQNQALDIVDNHKYLGVTFDKKLSWNNHMDEKLGKCMNNVRKLSAVGKNKFGLAQKTTKFIIERVIVPSLLYGAIVWGNATKLIYVKNKLKKFDRLASLAITHCLTPTATENLSVLAGLVPTDLQIDAQIANSFLRLFNNLSLIHI